MLSHYMNIMLSVVSFWERVF